MIDPQAALLGISFPFLSKAASMGRTRAWVAHKLSLGCDWSVWSVEVESTRDGIRIWTEHLRHSTLWYISPFLVGIFFFDQNQERTPFFQIPACWLPLFPDSSVCFFYLLSDFLISLPCAFS